MGFSEECVGHLRINFLAWSSTQSYDEELQGLSLFAYCDKKLPEEARVERQGMPKYYLQVKRQMTRTTFCIVPYWNKIIAYSGEYGGNENIESVLWCEWCALRQRGRGTKDDTVLYNSKGSESVLWRIQRVVLKSSQ